MDINNLVGNCNLVDKINLRQNKKRNQPSFSSQEFPHLRYTTYMKEESCLKDPESKQFPQFFRKKGISGAKGLQRQIHIEFEPRY